jgi:hypothetical protein
MAEFCLECLNRMNGTHYTKEQVELEEGLCEGCGEVKPCVIRIRRQVWFGLFWKKKRVSKGTTAR